MTPAIVRDSAGIRIVENRAAAWNATEAWQIGAEPVLRIGDVMGDPAYQFVGIRAIDLLPDGGVMVLDGGSTQLRRFDAGGRHVWIAGTRGRGPGQFEVPVYLGRDSASFFLWDRALARLTVVSADGIVLRSDSYATAVGDVPIAHQRFADGALLITVPTTIRPPAPGTILVDTVQLWRFDSATQDRRLLVRLPSPLWLWTGRYQLPVPFTAPQLRVVSGTHVIVATFAPEIHIYAATGDLAAKFVIAREPAPVTAADIDRTLDDWGRRRLYGAGLDVWTEWRDRLPVPPRRPAFDRLFVDGEGNIWARQFHIDADTSAAPIWDVLDPGGTHLGGVAAPRNLEIMTFGTRRLAGVSRDSLDVEHVLVYEILERNR